MTVWPEALAVCLISADSRAGMALFAEIGIACG